MKEQDPTLFGKVREKLIRRKQEWAKEGRLLNDQTAELDVSARLPPGQREVKDWPVLDLGVQPEISLEKWRLCIDGLVINPLTWDMATFLAQPQVENISDIHCVTAWSRYDNRWKGVCARHLLSVVKPLSEASFIVFHSYDGYTTNISLADFDNEDVLLAHSWEGKPLTCEHGGPVRVVVPKRYFWKSAKWVCRIELIGKNRPGFWEERGYHNEGDPWKEERYG